jgi:hypothetical protein
MGKIVITGTGRCGTSFLMHFFTALGLNTGYTLNECEQHLSRSGCNGGVEHSIGSELFDSSDIVKNPEWMYKPELLDFDIEAIILPVRKLEDVAISRSFIGHNAYGGFWRGAKSKEDQMKIDAKAFYDFINYCVVRNLELLLLDFPRIVYDCDYLYNKIGSLEDKDLFDVAFNEIASPEKISVS